MNSLPKTGARLVIVSGAILALASPTVAYGSDMTGAVGYGLAWLVLLLLGAGAITAAVLRFGFKRSNRVWLLIPALPAIGVGCLIAFLVLQPQSKNYHKGPDIPYGGSHSVTVSKDFGESGLDRAYAIISSARFKSEVSAYTRESVSDFTFAIDLTVPPNPEARHDVSISVQPMVSVGNPTYEAVMYVFSKVVLEVDPLPSDAPYSEPQKVK